MAWEAAGVRSDATFVMLAITPAGQVSTFCFTGGRALFVDGAVMLESREVLDWFEWPGSPDASVNTWNAARLPGLLGAAAATRRPGA